MTTLEVFDFTYLSKITAQIQDTFECSMCHIKHNKKWCKADNTQCFFCTQFIPFRDTRRKILNNIEWWFLKSGETSRREYYNTYINHLDNWCKVFNILKTRDDMLYEDELRSVRDWSRDYWH